MKLPAKVKLARTAAWSPSLALATASITLLDSGHPLLASVGFCATAVMSLLTPRLDARLAQRAFASVWPRLGAAVDRDDLTELRGIVAEIGEALPSYGAIQQAWLVLYEERPAEALLLLEKVPRRSRHRIQADHTLCHALIELGRVEEAEAICARQKPALLPVFSDVRARAHHAKGRYPDAVRELRAILARPHVLGGYRALALWRLGDSLRAVGDELGACQAYEEAIAAAPDSKPAKKAREALAKSTQPYRR